MYLKFITHPSLSTCRVFFYKFAYMIMAIRFIEIQEKKKCLWKKWDKRLADMMEKGKNIQ